MIRVFALPVALLAAGALAENSSQDVAVLPGVLITATRTELPLEEVLAPSVVISRADIDRSMALDISNLLRFHAGLEISRAGGPGQQTSVFIRGTDSNQAVVLIDGVKINPATTGGAALQNISPDIVERIEVVKGPRSSLYGSDAIGGVINVITRRADGAGFVDVSARGGRFSTRGANLSTGYAGEHGDIGLVASWLQSDGFPTRTDSTTNRGYDNLSVNLQGGTRFGPVESRLRFWNAAGTTEYTDFFLNPVSQDYQNTAAALEFGGQPGRQWNTSVRLSQIIDDITQNQSTDFVETRRSLLEWQNDISVGNHALVTGLDVSQVDTRSLSFGTGFDESFDVNALYASDMITFGRHRLLLAGRYTDDQRYGDEFTWNAEYGLGIASSTRFVVLAGTGFRAPDSTDLFGFGGNPNLKPETSTTAELSVRHLIGAHHSISGGLFRTDIDNLINFVVTDPATFAGQNENVDQARITGVEMQYRFTAAQWGLRVEAILQDPEDLTTGETLLRRAKESLTVNLTRAIGRHQLGLDMLATGERKDFGVPEPVTLAPYVLIDLTGQFTINRHWSVQGVIDNLLNEQYELARGFNTADRGVYIRVNYQSR